MLAALLASVAAAATVSYQTVESPCTADYDAKRFTEKQMKDSARAVYMSEFLDVFDCNRVAGAASVDEMVADGEKKLDAIVGELNALDLPTPELKRLRDRRREDYRIVHFIQVAQARFWKAQESKAPIPASGRDASALRQKHDRLDLPECAPLVAELNKTPADGGVCPALGRWHNCALEGLRKRKRSYVLSEEGETAWKRIVKNVKCDYQLEPE